jgi:hypothetical protein
MPVAYKDIIITPYRSDATLDPKIEFRGANASVNTAITAYMYPTSNGTLSFEGSVGQLLAITNDLTGSIFSVNDISGVPLIDVNADGSVFIGSAAGGSISFRGNIANQTLTDAATITWDLSLGQIATVTLGGNRTIAAPTNMKVGSYVLHVLQDGSGSRTLTWNSVFKWPAGVAPVLTTTASRRDVFSFVCDGTNMYGSFLPDVR